ncbi:PilN domain-containing protein [Undibacterium sp. Jales W-56]|uniref:PilN domain-containing protein n=1 Tax=Undibacterium sp. Jales W-56 TaxID=2897325 RepID=UPI0021CF096D|nr:PilN domain-containing protein [Undibacterium sp. Jales W-56]MCU6432700.1 PilN domain-containing protein [Undibacterium sp. Jales W-56]
MSQQINLFNPQFLKQNMVFSAVTMLQVAGLLIGGVMLLMSYLLWQTANLSKNADQVDAQLRDAEAQIGKLRAELVQPQKNRQLESVILKAETELNNKQKILTLLQKSDFGNTSGYSNYLLAFARQIPTGVWLTGLSIDGAGSEIGLQGRALKPELLPVYVNRLRQENSLQGKSFSSLQMQMPANETGKQESVTTTALLIENIAKTAKTQTSYIEFSLRSTGAVDGAEASGAKSK